MSEEKSVIDMTPEELEEWMATLESSQEEIPCYYFSNPDPYAKCEPSHRELPEECFFDENGNIEAIQDATTPTTYYPIPIRGLFVGDKIHGNYDAKDSNAISWYYQPGYSDALAIVAPAGGWNPLTDLENAVNA